MTLFSSRNLEFLPLRQQLPLFTLAPASRVTDGDDEMEVDDGGEEDKGDAVPEGPVEAPVAFAEELDDTQLRVRKDYVPQVCVLPYLELTVDGSGCVCFFLLRPGTFTLLLHDFGRRSDSSSLSVLCLFCLRVIELFLALLNRCYAQNRK